MTQSAEHPSTPPLVPLGASSHNAPRVRLERFDQLWFQLTGTLCNLACTHCFISCAPGNRTFGFLDYDAVVRALEESARLGVKEYYFTGGEPFMHPRILDVLARTLEIGPATVLTNGTLLTPAIVQRLAELRDRSIYSLEMRFSLDGPDAERNDRIRGKGAFASAMAGLRRLVDAGFLPIVTVAQTWGDDGDADQAFAEMRTALIEAGYARPRLKILPALRIGAEAMRGRPYRPDERVTADMMAGYDTSRLLCSGARIVTDRGVHVCPILIEQPDSLLGQSLTEAADRDYALRHQACHTCWMHGAICSNASSVGSVEHRPTLAPGHLASSPNAS